MNNKFFEQVADATGAVNVEESERLEASSFAEFVQALFLGLAVLLFVSTSMFLLFSGIVATLLGLVS